MKIGFASLLTFLFITLKLTGVINWSWVWVLAPAWIGAVLALLLVAFVGLIALAVSQAAIKRLAK